MPEFKFFPETRVAFVSEIGDRRKSVSQGLKKLSDWLKANKVQASGPTLVILYDLPNRTSKADGARAKTNARALAQNQRYDVCIPIGPSLTASGEVQTKEIGGWKVATVTYQGEKGAQRVFDQLYEWLREQGYGAADLPIVKYTDGTGENARAEIGVPVIRQDLMPASTKIKKETVKSTTKSRTVGSGTSRKTLRKAARRTAK